MKPSFPAFARVVLILPHLVRALIESTRLAWDEGGARSLCQTAQGHLSACRSKSKAKRLEEHEQMTQALEQITHKFPWLAHSASRLNHGMKLLCHSLDAACFCVLALTLCVLSLVVAALWLWCMSRLHLVGWSSESLASLGLGLIYIISCAWIAKGCARQAKLSTTKLILLSF